jgi:hypothetical protein
MYCDESGNSGPNYLDKAQPFYVLAGWVIPDRSNEAACVAIEQLRQKISPQSSELKSAAILKGERQKTEAAGLFAELGRLGAIPLYLIAEKRFCIAAKVVETFLDPAFNPLLRNLMTSDRETKQEIANLLYDGLPDQELIAFAEAYRKPSGPGLKAALLNLAAAAREHLNPELAEALLGCEQDIESIAEVEAANSPFGSVGAALNMPCLVSFLMMTEALGRAGLHQPIRFVHDRQHAYEEGYRKIFEIHRGMPHLFSMPSDDGLPFGKLEAVAEFETADSKDRLPLQAADMLAGVLNHLSRLAINGVQPSSADIALARLTLPGLFLTDVKVAWPIWSIHCMGRVGTSLIVEAIRPESRPDKEIQKARAIANAREAPALPALLGTRKSPEAFELPSPLFALRGASSGGLMVLMPSEVEADDSGDEAEPVVPLFSSRTAAEQFRESFNDLSEPQEVVEFDGPDMFGFVDDLEVCGQFSEVLVFDPSTPQMAHMYLPALLAGLRAMLSRTERLVGTGLDRVVLRRTCVGGRDALSMLLMDGRYGAMWAPAGKVVTGATRAEALANLAKTPLPPAPTK